LLPRLGVSFFPRTDAGMFVINVKAPSGSRISVTESEVAKVEALIRQIVPERELGTILSNIGVTPGFSSIYTSNSAQHTAFVQVGLKEDHRVGLTSAQIANTTARYDYQTQRVVLDYQIGALR